MFRSVVSLVVFTWVMAAASTAALADWEAYSQAWRWGDYEEANRLLHEMADAGDRNAASQLSELYEEGEQDLPVDLARAQYYFELSQGRTPKPIDLNSSGGAVASANAPSSGQLSKAATILGYAVGTGVPRGCVPRQENWTRNFGLEEYKIFTCLLRVDGEDLKFFFSGVNSPEQIIQIRRRQVWNNFNGFDVAEQAIAHYGANGSNRKDFKGFYFQETSWEYSGVVPHELELKYGECQDPNLGWRCPGVTYVQYIARDARLQQIVDGLVEASKKVQKF